MRYPHNINPERMSDKESQFPAYWLTAAWYLRIDAGVCYDDLGDVGWGATANNQARPILTLPAHMQPVRTCEVPKQASSWQSTNKGLEAHEAGRLAWQLASLRHLIACLMDICKRLYPRVC